MTFELREVLQIIALILVLISMCGGGMALFYRLRTRVAVVEARQDDDREANEKAFDRLEKRLGEDRMTNRRDFDEIKRGLAAIDQKLDRKADK